MIVQTFRALFRVDLVDVDKNEYYGNGDVVVPVIINVLLHSDDHDNRIILLETVCAVDGTLQFLKKIVFCNYILLIIEDRRVLRLIIKDYETVWSLAFFRYYCCYHHYYAIC